MYRFSSDTKVSIDRVAGIILKMVRDALNETEMRLKFIDIDYVAGIGYTQKPSTFSVCDDGCIIIHDGRLNHPIVILNTKGMKRPTGDDFCYAICGIMPSWSKIFSDFKKTLKGQAKEFDNAGKNAKEFIQKFGGHKEAKTKFHVGDIVTFDPFSVDDEEYWDDYKEWKKGKAEILAIEPSGHPFLHVKIRSLENPRLVDWVDLSWLEI